MLDNVYVFAAPSPLISPMGVFKARKDTIGNQVFRMFP
jgi:hypothetical protein